MVNSRISRIALRPACKFGNTIKMFGKVEIVIGACVVIKNTLEKNLEKECQGTHLIACYYAKDQSHVLKRKRS